MKPESVRPLALGMAIISLALLAMAALGARYVHRGHVLSSERIVQHVNNMLAAEDLEIEMREVRNRLNGYLRTGDQRELDAIAKLRVKAQPLFRMAKSSAMTADERHEIEVLEQGYDHFFVRFQELVDQLPSAEAKTGLSDLIDHLMAREIFAPARRYVERHRQEMLRSSLDSQLETQRMGGQLLLLGASGAIAGGLAGVALARRMRLSLIRLEVPIHGVADELDEVIGPLMISTTATQAGLERTLQSIAGKVHVVIERLHQSQRDVRRADQLSAVGRLAAGLAHELRNALMPMKILVQDAREKRGGLVAEDLAVIDHEIARLETAVSRFLDFARPIKPEETLFDFRGIVEESLQLIDGRASAQRVRLKRQLPALPVMATADKDQLRQVLMNLLLNALDSMPSGGQLTVSVTAGGAPAGRVQLSVIDSGYGIAPEVARRLFEPFFSTKETGSGLGLSICRQIVEAHHGTITGRNVEAGGAEFLIELPCAAHLPSDENNAHKCG